MKETIKDCVGYLKNEPLIAFVLFLLWTNYNLNQRFQFSQEVRISDLIRNDSLKLKLSSDRTEAWIETSNTKNKQIIFLESFKDTVKK